MRGAATAKVLPFLEATPEELAIVGAYDRRLQRILRQSARRDILQVRRIESAFSTFRLQALQSLPDRARMSQAAIAGTLDRISQNLDDLTREVGLSFTNGITNAERTTQRITSEFADTFLGDPRSDALAGRLSILGGNPAALSIANEFSAELIGLNQGGLGSKIKGEINRVVRLAALGAGPGQFNAAREISKALFGPEFGARWSFQAERIYRTEVLRVQSLTAQASITELNKIKPTRKRWIWSGISRKQHQGIHEQTVAANGKFKVPTRSAGVVPMRFPRDPTAPPDASINCGCYVVPWPAKSTARGASRTTTRRIRKPRAKPKPKAVPQSAKKISRTTKDTGFVPAKTLAEAEATAKTWANNVAYKGGDIVDDAYLAQRFGPLMRAQMSASQKEALMKRFRRQESRSFGGALKTKAKKLEHLNLTNREFDRLSRLYPKIAPRNLGGLGNIAITNTKRARAHVRFKAPRATMSVSQSHGEGVYGTAAARESVEWKSAEEYRKWLEKKRGKKIHRGYNPDETGLYQTARHEYGHILDGHLGIQADAEWIALMDKYDDAFFWENLSEYSRHKPYSRHTKLNETWAELFRATTSPNYVKGRLPRDLEAFVEKVIGAEL